MHRPNPPLEPGDKFEGRYEILAKLGEGGFGTVYKARQETTGQPVALKIMRLVEHGGAAQAAQMDKRVARFLREARLCAQLHHPNTVQLIDVGQTGEGLLYTVFAFAPGETLAELLAREGALAPREAQHLMLQVLDALACAHAEGVVHRDLKPSNIMVIPTGARRNALVLDFGISAMAEGAPGGQLTRLTATDETLGTPGYAAPEQLRGLDPSPRADLFSWGLIFLECLTGEPVYRGSSAAEIFYQQLSADPVPIPASLSRHPLGQILGRATRKDEAEREVTARELLLALEDCELRRVSREALMTGEGPAGAADGSALSSSTSETREIAPSASLLGGERRQLTAVSCVLSPRAATSRELDVEEIDELLRASITTCAEIARRHRGAVATSLGDEVLLYFGYLRAEEDDAQRAALAALAIVAAIQEESERLTAARGVRVEARLGVHTGLVIAGSSLEAPGWGLGVGATPRIAARLAAEAPPGVALVSAEAQRLLRATFELAALAPSVGEGSAEPRKVFRLQQALREQTTTVTPEASKAPLAGREQEVELLLERWRRVRAGAGQCSLITGEPGIGKSRLVRELRGRLRGEAQIFLEGRCSADAQNSALYPFVELLGRALKLDQESSPGGRITRLEAQLVRHGFTPAEVMPLFLPLLSLPLVKPYAPLDVSPQKQKELTNSAILSLIFAMAEEGPVLFLVEDLHWADPSTLELLTQLVHEAPSARLGVLLTARPEFSPAFPTTGMLQLHLSRLEPTQIEAMVGELLGHKALPVEVVEQVVRRTDGVPLFVEELTQMMVESGVLVEREARYELVRPLSEVEIPGTLRALLTARLDRLGRAKETAQIAASLGREFSAPLLLALGPSGERAAQEDLDRLTSAGIVFRKRRIKEQAYVFKHALVRDAAYESLPRETRKTVHARIARALEERFPEIVKARPDLLAHHHAAAEQKREAIKYAQRAGGEALMRSANAEALRHAREATAWLSAIDNPRARAEAELALNGVMTPALMSLKGYTAPGVEPLVRRSQELIEVLGDGPYTFPTLWALVTYHHTLSHREEARAIAERMVGLSERAEDASLRASALVLLGNCRWLEGRYEPAKEALLQAVSLYDADKHRRVSHAYALDPKAWAYASLGPVLWSMGYPDQALRYAEAALSWGRELNHTNTIGLAYFYLGSIHYYNGDRDSSLAVARELIEFATGHGLSYNEDYGRIFHGWAARELKEARRIVDAHEASGTLAGITFYRAAVAEISAALGQHGDALAEIARCLRLADETGERYNLSVLYRLEGTYLLARDPGAEEEAEACFQRAIEVARSQGALMLELLSTSALCRLLGRRGLLAEARDRLTALCGRFTEGLETPPLKEARSLLQKLDERGR